MTVIRGEVKSIRYKSSPLIRGSLQIPTEVTVKWEESSKGHGHFAQESRKVSHRLGDNDRCIDEYKDILKSVLNDDLSTD